MTKRSKFDLPIATAFIAGYTDPAGGDSVDITIHIEIDDDDARQLAFAADLEPAIAAIWRERRNEEGCKGTHLHPQGAMPAMTVRLKHEGIVRNEKTSVDEKGMKTSFHWIGASITSRPVIKVPSHDAFKKGEDGSKIVVVIHTKQKVTEQVIADLHRLKGVRGFLEMFASNPDMLDEAGKKNGTNGAHAEA
jgi:hypothetical protein